MTTDQIEALGPAFSRYLRQYDCCCDYPQTFQLFGVYCRGLLSDLPRKTAEPIALASGTAVRTLQEFLKDHLWSYPIARDTLQQHVVTTLQQVPADDLGTIGIVDETSTVKKGTKTPGVQRQHCGERGKIENCIVTVHLAVARGQYTTLVDGALYLPLSWHNDRQRCREADIPDHVVYQPKWQLALRQVLRGQAVGLDLDWLTFDEGYGGKPGFLRGLDEMHIPYIGEVPRSFRCFTAPPRPRQPGRRADNLAAHSSVFHQQQWQEFALARRTLGDQIWQAKIARVWLRLEGQVGQSVYWLIWARNELTGEEKYFIAGGAAGVPLSVWLRVGFSRYNVEHCLRLVKSELGFRHFEGRSYIGLMRHMMLCLVTQGFAAGEAVSLRGGKSRGDNGAGLYGLESDLSAVVGDESRHTCAGQSVGNAVLSATT
jgi:SRSO17 transposase